MTIERKEIFITKDKQFDSLEKAEQYRADLLGQFMDSAISLWGPYQRLQLNDYMVKNCKAIMDLLDW